MTTTVRAHDDRASSKASVLRALMWLVLGLGQVVTMPGVAEAASQKQVLVLYATRRDAQIAVVGDRVMPRILEERLENGLDYYTEYIDTSRFPDPQYRVAFKNFLRLKYLGQRFDLVIAVLDTAVEFIGTMRQELFADTPIVFFAASPDVRRPPNSAGIIAEVDFGDTVALALQLQPDIRQVFVVSGADQIDRVYERQARARLRSFEPKLSMTYLSGLPTADLLARVASLPSHSIVLFLIVSADGAGEFFHPLEFVDRVTEVANAPMYSWVDSALAHGIVGGSLRTQEAQIGAIADLARRVLGGEPADSIPLIAPVLNVRQVDWRQLRRWDISETRVPAGTLVKFREPSVWERDRLYIVSGAALLLAQSMLIAGLIAQAARRRQAEAKLRASQDQLRLSHAQLLNAGEIERFRIARELHDDVGQRMAVLTMEIDGFGEGLGVMPNSVRAGIRALSDRATALAKHIQSISRLLHSSKLDYMSLESASADLCRELSEQQHFVVDFRSHDIPHDVPKNVALCMFRVLQEAMNNAVKHSDARRVTVVLSDSNNEIRLEVIDDGIGFDPGAVTSHPGLGLISMKERLTIVDGELTIESRPGAGALIRARVPLAAPVV